MCFHSGSIHSHIILWINYIDVNHITNKIVVTVLAIIDEQFEKFILPNNEYDLTLFKLLKWKQMHQCVSWCKTNKYIGICKYKFPMTIFVEQHATQHPIPQRWMEKNSTQFYDFWVN